MGTVVEILIASAPETAMESVPSAHAIPGKGLEGDRYFLGAGTFSPKSQEPEHELTLIELEKVEEFANVSDLPFTAAQARRNIVTEGINLNSLVGREFSIGEVRIRGIGLCEPCTHLAKISFPETLNGLIHKGGLRAQILTKGLIRVGDIITLP